MIIISRRATINITQRSSEIIAEIYKRTELKEIDTAVTVSGQITEIK